ncbi:hypothetical protein K1719_001616 [Acacia pycnantha]|nr:hypothetical protein K1719_001616 [Acacia pycnantha]
MCGSARCTDPFGAILQPCLEKVIEVLADANAHLIGVYGSNDELKDVLVEKVCRRVGRDKLFDKDLTITLTKKPDVKKIQEEIASQLGFTFNNKSKDKRAHELIERLKIEQKILIILRDLHKGLDLGKVGIPFGADHTGCKILLTSTTEDVLSNQMHTQKNFRIGS